MTKKPPCRFKHSLGHFKMLSVHKYSDTGPFRHLNNPAFCTLYFQKEITPGDHNFFQSISQFMSILEMQLQIQQIFFDFEIMAFELVALDTRFY